MGLISGEYSVDETRFCYGERTSTLTICIVTDETHDKDFESFEKELQELLAKYAI